MVVRLRSFTHSSFICLLQWFSSAFLSRQSSSSLFRIRLVFSSHCHLFKPNRLLSPVASSRHFCASPSNAFVGSSLVRCSYWSSSPRIVDCCGSLPSHSERSSLSSIDTSVDPVFSSVDLHYRARLPSRHEWSSLFHSESTLSSSLHIFVESVFDLDIFFFQSLYLSFLLRSSRYFISAIVS